MLPVEPRELQYFLEGAKADCGVVPFRLQGMPHSTGVALMVQGQRMLQLGGIADG